MAQFSFYLLRWADNPPVTDGYCWFDGNTGRRCQADRARQYKTIEGATKAQDIWRLEIVEFVASEKPRPAAESGLPR